MVVISLSIQTHHRSAVLVVGRLVQASGFVVCVPLVAGTFLVARRGWVGARALLRAWL